MVHAVRQAPQCCGSVVRSVQTPPQATSAPGQRQCAFVHTRPPEQARPQPPQFAELVWRSTQLPPQAARFPAQLIMHIPDEHTSFTRQTFPHAPQFAASLDVSMHCPAHTTARPGQTHAPAAHARPRPHAAPHPPQFDTLVFVSTQVAPHAISGSVHCEAHVPWSHT
jgi:hypothetical protein